MKTSGSAGKIAASARKMRNIAAKTPPGPRNANASRIQSPRAMGTLPAPFPQPLERELEDERLADYLGVVVDRVGARRGVEGDDDEVPPVVLRDERVDVRGRQEVLDRDYARSGVCRVVDRDDLRLPSPRDADRLPESGGVSDRDDVLRDADRDVPSPADVPHDRPVHRARR